MDSQGSEWTLLWGSEHEFYEKLGFTPHGIQARALVSDLSVSPRGPATGVPKQGLTDAIFESLLSRKTGVEFTPTDRSWIFAHKSVEWFYLESPFAYIAYQRGMDLQNVVHEMGGDEDGIRTLLFHVFKMNPNAEVLSTPEGLRALGFEKNTWFEEPLCLARPKDPGTPWNPEFWISGLGAV
jgi:hypothetical protein